MGVIYFAALFADNRQLSILFALRVYNAATGTP